MSLIKTFKDKLGNIIYPTTHAKAVLVEKDGTVVNLQTAIDNGNIGGSGAPKLDINPSASTIADYSDGTLWLTSSNNKANLFAKVNGRKYTLQLEESLDEIALKFSSDSNFTLSAPKKWDGTLEYTIDNGSTWNTWNGSQLSGTSTQPIYLRGTGNTIITGDGFVPWAFTGKYCTGNIENLLDYQTVANGGHPVMGDACYSFMFNACTSLIQAPQLPATTLTSSCYQLMFSGCTSLKLSTTQTGEYQYAYRIPTSGTGTTATDALTDMFIDTGGTFTGTPTINTTYYTTNQPV